ncbi:SRSO17 transposase [Parafrankia irregularis]|uniref:SRSO17 transposase n=1 Tax=Parafrankia irregularis TaxID=795642 RepID=A0A0S4QIX7_9ACTN|nr:MULTISPECIES: IS701 family transposase [Parafrankia]MBE3203934.1 IS701 family transposase [Parafrankia sp. CH37]CUU55193.1 SRSO17 transposase [Parafrankia irregularis]
MTTEAILDPWSSVEDLAQPQETADELDLLHARVAHRFGRPEPRRRALAYLRGLVSVDGARHGQALAAAAGESSPDGMQRLLTAAGWDADLVRDDLLGYVRQRHVHAAAALVVDEVVLPGRGPRFAGAAPRYLAESGRVESCQVAVFAAYATGERSILVDRELCLPSPWDTDRRLRRSAGVPDDHEQGGSRELAAELVARATRRLPVRWILLGPALGGDDRLRAWLARNDVAFVARIGPGTTIGTTIGRRVTAAALAAAADRRQGGEAWAQIRVRPSRGGRWDHRLLLRRRPQSEPLFYACHVPRGTSLNELVDAARRTGAVRDGVRRARATVGLDSYRVRSWTGWYRHMTLAMLAAAATGASAAAPSAAIPSGAMPSGAMPSSAASSVAAGSGWGEVRFPTESAARR